MASHCLTQGIMQTADQRAITHDIAQGRDAVILTINQRASEAAVLGDVNGLDGRASSIALASALRPGIFRLQELASPFG